MLSDCAWPWGYLKKNLLIFVGIIELILVQLNGLKEI